MIDNRTFGSFIREKRIEKGLKQRELADILYVTESAISKWETGKSYPDITMIPSICKVLDVSEKELIEGANDTESRVMKKEARKYRIISDSWFWGLAIFYGIALLVCIICDLAINHRLSFSIIVFTSLLVAFSFAPTFTRFFENHKFAIFLGTTYLSLCLLFIVCCIMYRQSWCWVASFAVLLGYAVLFLPFLLKRYIPEEKKGFNVLLYFASLLVLLLLLLVVIRGYVQYPLGKAVLISLYCFIPFLFLSAIHLLKLPRLIKASLDVLVFGVVYYGIEAVIARIVGEGAAQYYTFDFTDWKYFANGNIMILYLIATISVAVVLASVYLLHWMEKEERL